MSCSRYFFKYEGAGNDFVLFEDYDESFPIKAVRQICHRNFGVGGDGVLLLQKSKVADVKMRIFNQDGSEATMCGNGLRCVIHHLGKPCTVETASGLSEGELGRATLPKAIIVKSPIPLEDNLIGHLVDTGTPHLVIFTKNPPHLDIISRYRSHTNVNFAHITKEGIHVRTFEKGVDTETLSCGTGGAAVALLCKHLGNKIKILFTSSSLTFLFDSRGKLWMEGPTRQIFQGNLCLENLN